MSSVATERRRFKVGTTGWTVADLEDPQIERRWFSGRYEIVEGVLTTMPAAYFVAGEAVCNLVFRVHDHVRQAGVKARFSTGVDIVLSERRVARSDGCVQAGVALPCASGGRIRGRCCRASKADGAAVIVCRACHSFEGCVGRGLTRFCTSFAKERDPGRRLRLPPSAWGWSPACRPRLT